MPDSRKPKINKWGAFAIFMAIAAFMYGSIMYKIVNYGP